MYFFKNIKLLKIKKLKLFLETYIFDGQKGKKKKKWYWVGSRTGSKSGFGPLIPQNESES